ncbi:MAG: hypothetical protein AAF849_19910 [Bacteroidota bacterium]
MKRLFSILCVVFLSVAAIQAQDVTVDEIIDNYLENIGGVEAWKEVKSMKMTGVVNQMGMELPSEVISMEPNLTKITVEVQGMTMIPQAYDGENGWMINPFAGGTDATKMPEEAAEEMAKQPFQDEFIDYKEKGSTVVLSDEVKEIDGTETYEVKLVNKHGDEKFYYFDTENFVPIMQKQTISTGPMKGSTIETYVSDYKEVGDLMIAHSMEVKGAQGFVMTMEKIEVNPEDVTKASFMMPAKEEKEEEKQ